MPRAKVVIYCEENGQAPLLAWLDALPAKVQVKCTVKIERLKVGHELRRPEADFLKTGSELRASYQSVNYRILYFFRQDRRGPFPWLDKEGCAKRLTVLLKGRKFESDPSVTHWRKMKAPRRKPDRCRRNFHRRYFEGKPERLAALENDGPTRIARSIYELQQGRADPAAACSARRDQHFGNLPAGRCRLRRALSVNA